MKLKKSTLAVIATTAVLLISVGVLVLLNAGRVKQQAGRLDGAYFVIKAEGQTYTVDFALLKEAGITTFTATRRSSTGPAAEVEYQGVLLSDLCRKLNLDWSRFISCAATAADGYIVPVSLEKIAQPDNVYIVTGQDGQPLPTRDEGGDGPYMLVVVKDPFSQYWCKYLTELEFK